MRSDAVKRATPIWPLILTCLFAAPLIAASCERSLVVTATAYNSLPEQTNDQPNLTAWGDSLIPGRQAIAVSRDLIPLGLDHRTSVSIKGLSGKFLVLDKMNKRWKKRIDIYMGDDLEAARTWGKRQVEIRW